MAAKTDMTDAEVIAVIRRCHLKANIQWYPRRSRYWSEARLDPGGTIFGSGPYVKLPVDNVDGERVTIRVYAPARLQRSLSKRWRRDGR